MARAGGATYRPKKNKTGNKNQQKKQQKQQKKGKKDRNNPKPPKPDTKQQTVLQDIKTSFNIENTVYCGTRFLTSHLLSNYISADGEKENFNKKMDIIFENDYALEIFNSKLIYQQNQSKLNTSNKKDYIRRRHKNDTVVLFCINDPLSFMTRVEEGEKRKELHKLNSNAHKSDENEEQGNKSSRKYIIYTKKVTTEMLNSGFRIKYLTKSAEYTSLVRLEKIEIEAKTSFYELLDQSISKNKGLLQENLEKSENLKNESENQKKAKEQELLDKRTPIYIFNPSPNSYFALLLKILDSLKKYNSRILIITTNPNKLVDILHENSVECAQYHTTSYTEDYKKLETKTSRIIVSNVRYTFERFDFVIEFCLKDLQLLEDTINKKMSKAVFELQELEVGGNQKKLDILKTETKKVSKLEEVIFEKGKNSYLWSHCTSYFLLFLRPVYTRKPSLQTVSKPILYNQTFTVIVNE